MGSQTRRDYLEFYVSGVSMKTRLGLEEADLITVFLFGISEQALQDQINIYRRKATSGVADGRIMLYVCPECGDLDCGAVMMTIRREGDKIIWSDFAFETGHGGISERITEVDSLAFDKSNYFAVFQEIAMINRT